VEITSLSVEYSTALFEAEKFLIEVTGIEYEVKKVKVHLANNRYGVFDRATHRNTFFVERVSLKRLNRKNANQKKEQEAGDYKMIKPVGTEHHDLTSLV